MTESEFLDRLDHHTARIDAHIAVANEHMAVANEHMAVANEHMAVANEHMASIRDHMAATREELTATREQVAIANGHMERGNALMARIEVRMDRGDELFDRCIRATEDLRALIKEMTVRSERSHRAMIAEIAAGRREPLDQRGVLVDLHDASRAQNDALMRVVERLEPRDG